jgi:hypothetical protein
VLAGSGDGGVSGSLYIAKGASSSGVALSEPNKWEILLSAGMYTYHHHHHQSVCMCCVVLMV